MKEIGTVYVVGFDTEGDEEAQEGPYKIGFTSKGGKNRTERLQTANHRKMKVIWEFMGVSHHLERDLHAQFEHKRLRGEWFDLDKDDLDWIADLKLFQMYGDAFQKGDHIVDFPFLTEIHLNPIGSPMKIRTYFDGDGWSVIFVNKEGRSFDLSFADDHNFHLFIGSLTDAVREKGSSIRVEGDVAGAYLLRGWTGG